MTDNPLSDLPVDGGVRFEDLANQNGSLYWFASDVATLFGYQSYSSFEKIVNKAIGVVMTLGIPVVENFEQTDREVDGHRVRDFKISRFGCYLLAMNADSKKEPVARTQAYFAGLAEAFQRYIDQSSQIERVHIRDEVSTQERNLSKVAKSAGVENYAFFHSAGYRGLYNMDLWQLKKLKRPPDAKRLLDFMGTEELAANLFRITQTEAKIKRESVKGQKPAERAAEEVGRRVRKTILEMGGTPPEKLKLADDIRGVKTTLKQTHREFRKLDEPKKAKKPKKGT